MLARWWPASLAVFLLTSLIPPVYGRPESGGDVCGKVIASTAESLNADDVYSCLVSTPFRPDVARDLLDYWKTSLEFQSTLVYLANPPRSYQQPAVDLIRGMDLVRAGIDTGVFESQYSFETAVQDLLFAAHDTHVSLRGSILGIFAFGAPFELATISIDGMRVPKVYMASDVSAQIGYPDWEPSPVRKINGEFTEEFLTVYASHHSFGHVEPHGDWNGVMYSAAGAVLGKQNVLARTMFYPGESLTLEFQNGTTYGPVPWRAYNIQARGLSTVITTGDDLYDYFVLGDSALANSASDANTTPDGPTSGDSTAPPAADHGGGADAWTTYTGWGGVYPPEADISSPDLGYGGVLTGYFLKEDRIGVLSIPSFEALGQEAETFSDTIGQFLKQSRDLGMAKIVVDLQQNTGGVQLLATDTFRQFFPAIDPFSGMRARSFQMADEIGNTFTDLLNHNFTSLSKDVQDALIEDPFAVVMGELNAGTGRNFTTWAEYYGPHLDHDDHFSTVFRYDLSNKIFTEEAAGFEIYGYGNRSREDVQPYDAKDIVLLTDGACASTCDLFVEMMHHEAGVRTVAVGGLPQHGPMQARGGTRGALIFTSDQLDADINFASLVNSTLREILPNRTSSPALLQSLITVNFADQIRPRENVPLQFTYEAADCRIYWTPETINNYTALWLYAADAVFVNASTCVAHSAEHNVTMLTDLLGPSQEQKDVWAATSLAWRPKYNTSTTAMSTLAQVSYEDPGVHEACGPEEPHCLPCPRENLHLDTPCDACIGQPCEQRNCNSNIYMCRSVTTCESESAGKTPPEMKVKMCDRRSDCPPGYRCRSDLGYCTKAPSHSEIACRNRMTQKSSPLFAARSQLPRPRKLHHRSDESAE